MSDVNQLLLANFTEALSQVQKYIVLGLGTSVSALALVFAAPTPEGGQSSVTPPGTFVAIDPRAARIVLLAACVVVGAMGAYAAESANGIAARLIPSAPQLLDAARTFPSVATSPYPGVRYLAALSPLVLALAAVLIPAIRSTPVQWTAPMVWFVFLSAAYIPLAIELRKPVGAP